MKKKLRKKIANAMDDYYKERTIEGKTVTLYAVRKMVEELRILKLKK